MSGTPDWLAPHLAAAAAFADPESCTAEDVLAYWYGPLHSERLPQDAEYLRKMDPVWGCGASLHFDMVQRCNRSFIDAVAAGKCAGGSWDTPRGILAKIIVLDQWTRCAFRGSIEAFKYDEEACRLAKQSVDSGAYEKYLPMEKFWVTIALSHAEDVELNVLHANLGRALQADKTLPQCYQEHFAWLHGKGYPWAHEEVVKRFGRFPHRNKLFGRESTPDEIEWLASDDLPNWARSQSRVKLVYWDERGMGDMVRFLLEFAMIPYDEENITSKSQFQEFKAAGRAAFDQVPMLEIDGFRVVQTQAILRYIAGKKSLRGESLKEEALADGVAAAVADHRMPLITIPCKDDPEEARKQWITVNLPKLCRQLEGLMAEHGGCCLAGPTITYADVAVFELFTYANDVCKEEVDRELAKHPKLRSAIDRIGAYKHMVEFLASPSRRPVHDEGFVRRVFAILDNPLPKYMQARA